ncbi:C6 zinc finger domain protein [Colletotrichum higginsianum IMI 349063]|uniref:C6 zinc finger domain protein n=1 Tax=Colletotrichum higginsianum (strain IMI 349063) TaxID=759273 RepID=A0A1B7Y032_COLHI|nr:C6 zinc finger domain protein [Colletotrichum higginsianum IMI 349063]OBR05361.1 C6 zinc finger domain protein [Colletotrichum higginsianum IMI 349063]
MARKGSRKVRTGCLTCNPPIGRRDDPRLGDQHILKTDGWRGWRRTHLVRKIKCDETRPFCNRCTVTGRKCDGYPHVADLSDVSSSSPGSSIIRLQPSRASPGINSPNDSRALQYFTEAVGPLLSGAVDPYFWTHIVMQFSTLEPAVTHSILAISDLYEQFHTGDNAAVVPRDHSFALRHYNAAIHELKGMMSREKQPVVLLVCLLFICIEFLRSGREAAIRHCKHGVAILRDTHNEFPWTKEHLLPLFRRLSEYSFFFSNEKSDFPDLSGLERHVPPTFSTFQDAQLMIDDIYCQTLQLMKKGYPYRDDSLRGCAVPPELLAQQENINQLLDRWNALFTQYNDRIRYSDTPTTKQFELEEDYLPKMLRGFLSTRYECCRIWLNMAFMNNQTGFDKFLTNYSRIVKNLATTVVVVSERSKLASLSAKTPKFMFETGYTPMLFFVATTCRHLETRLEALRLIPILGLPRENLWEMATLVAMARRTIELEHDISLDPYGRPLAPIDPGWTLPANEKRIVDMWTEPKTEEKNIMGHIVRGRIVGFFRRRADGSTSLHTEFVEVRNVKDEVGASRVGSPVIIP